MSAFYAVAYDDEIQLLTDGAIYADDGVIYAFEEKVWRSEHAPLAVTGRGAHGVVSAMAACVLALAGGGNVDWAVTVFQDTIARKKDRKDTVKIDMLIACISEAFGPKLYYFTTHDGFGEVEPFTLYDAGREHAGGPIPDEAMLAEFGFPDRMANSTLAEAGADLFEAMRRTKMEHVAHPDKPMLFAVGGHVDLTVVSALGVETTRLRTWEDEIGRKIEALPLLPRAVAA